MLEAIQKNNQERKNETKIKLIRKVIGMIRKKSKMEGTLGKCSIYLIGRLNLYGINTNKIHGKLTSKINFETYIIKNIT